MNHRLIAALAESVVPVFRDAFAKALAPFSARLDVIEARAPVKGERGDPGLPGERGEKGEVGNDGAPGRDGVDGRDGATGAGGEPGTHGINGKDGVDGKDAAPVTREQVMDAVREFEIAAIVEGLVTRHLTENPPKDGERGAPGERGAVGDPGRDGRDGQPGVPGMPGEKGFDGKNGRDGIDGKDGLGLDDYEEELEDGGRWEVRRYKREGVVVKEFRHITGKSIYRGVHRAGQKYLPGDTATWAGAMWHCNAETEEGPREGQKAWTLATKRGRDGKDGKDGNPGERGPEGRPGRDGGTW